MLIDTHCHINMMIKKKFDIPLPPDAYPLAQQVIAQAADSDVTRIINVGTSVIESLNCVNLAQQFEHAYATVGLHPNDCTQEWRADLKTLEKLVHEKEKHKIVGIGETGIDKHYPNFNMQRQKDAFRAQIELSLEHDLALVVHTREATDETLEVIDEYKGQISRGIIHCYSEDQSFADHVLPQGFVLGIGGALTYPKNNTLRDVFTSIPLEKIILETDAPFLPPQYIRGKQNHPREIKTIAQYLAEIRGESFEHVAATTTATARALFHLP